MYAKLLPLRRSVSMVHHRYLIIILTCNVHILKDVMMYAGNMFQEGTALLPSDALKQRTT